LKQGKVEYSWNQIRAWLQPKPGAEHTSHGDKVLAMPLQLIAPLFVAQTQATTKAQKKLQVDENIPDLFKKSDLQPRSGTPLARSTPVAAPAVGGSAEGTFAVSLSLVSANWPESLRSEIIAQQLGDSKLEIPSAEIEAKLKIGKAEFIWRHLAAWIKPSPPEIKPSQSDQLVELPLTIIVPLYMQQKPGGAPRKSASPAAAIPDLFTAQGKLVPPVEEEAKATTAAAAPSNKQAQTVSEVFGEPDKRNWTPNEIVQKTAHLPGVAGALIALQDGLLVASFMPPTWRTETIAAFLPQIFGRMNQYSKELRMGDLKSVAFAVEGGTLQIFNAGIIYFAALARTGAPLPLHELNLIATELSRHTK
jgi:predicted regulator of Ras-like GTPase activity (Roadblock/LC7/MglB family)